MKTSQLCPADCASDNWNDNQVPNLVSIVKAVNTQRFQRQQHRHTEKATKSKLDEAIKPKMTQHRRNYP